VTPNSPFRRRLEHLSAPQLERLLDDVKERGLRATVVLAGSAFVVGGLAAADPGAGVVGVLVASAAVFFLSKSELLSQLQPLHGPCADRGLDGEEAARLGAFVAVPVFAVAGSPKKTAAKLLQALSSSSSSEDRRA
jgi:hypothetical protein